MGKIKSKITMFLSLCLVTMGMMFGAANISAASNPVDAPNDWAFEESSVGLNDAIVAKYPAIDTDGDGFISKSEAQAYGGVISLASVKMEGTMNGIENFTQITGLYLSSARLIGEIPAGMGNLSNLAVLSLTNNQLSGEIPSTLGNLDNLTQLSLGRNQLGREIPESLNNLSKLVVFELSENHITSVKQSTYDFILSRGDMHYVFTDFNYTNNLAVTGRIDNDYEFDALPAYEQFPNYGIEFYFTLVLPDGTRKMVEPNVSGGKIVVAGENLAQIGNYSLIANGASLIEDTKFDNPEYITNFTIEEESTYSVTFNPNNETPIGDWEELEVAEGELVPLVEAPQKEGYTFVGWASGYGANDEPVFWNFEADLMPGFNMMLWAEYEKVTSSVTEEETSNPSSGATTSASEEKNSVVPQNSKAIETGSNNSSVIVLLVEGLLISGGYLITSRKRNR